jgi:FHA domain/Protein of unknown function (DUF3662)
MVALFVLLLLVLAGYGMIRYLLAPLRGALRQLPGALRGMLGAQDLAGLQRQAASEAAHLAMVSIDSRFLPNEIVVLLNPEDHARMTPLQDEFCAGIASLVGAEVKNGPRDKGLPFKAIGSLRVRVKEDARVRGGTVAVRGAFSEKTAAIGSRSEAGLAVLDVSGREIPLAGDQLFGRASYADVVLDGKGISREHAKISCRGSSFIVRDLGGANGTMLNGTPVTTARAKVGDQIRFGPDLIGTIRLGAGARDLSRLTTAPLSQRSDS